MPKVWLGSPDGIPASVTAAGAARAVSFRAVYR